MTERISADALESSFCSSWESGWDYLDTLTFRFYGAKITQDFGPHKAGDIVDLSLNLVEMVLQTYRGTEVTSTTKLKLVTQS